MTPAGHDPFDDVLARLLWHGQNAGRTLPRPVTDVRLGEPSVVAGPLLALWYDGDDEGELVPNTLTRASYTERVIARWYWPVNDRSPALAGPLETTLRRARRAFSAEINADADLGGACEEVRDIERSTAGWIDAQPGWIRILTITLGVEMVDVDTIGTEG